MPIAELRSDFRTYVLHGDNSWGDAITWSDAPTDERQHKGTVVGWQASRPRVGDRLLVKMRSGRWGWWLFTAVEYADNVADMFFADVVGAFGYVEPDEEPKTKLASEFLRAGSAYV